MVTDWIFLRSYVWLVNLNINRPDETTDKARWAGCEMNHWMYGLLYGECMYQSIIRKSSCQKRNGYFHSIKCVATGASLRDTADIAKSKTNWIVCCIKPSINIIIYICMQGPRSRVAGGHVPPNILKEKVSCASPPPSQSCSAVPGMTFRNTTARIQLT